jgi:hypothetical protein
MLFQLDPLSRQYGGDALDGRLIFYDFGMMAEVMPIKSSIRW